MSFTDSQKGSQQTVANEKINNKYKIGFDTYVPPFGNLYFFIPLLWGFKLKKKKKYLDLVQKLV